MKNRDYERPERNPDPDRLIQILRERFDRLQHSELLAAVFCGSLFFSAGFVLLLLLENLLYLSPILKFLIFFGSIAGGIFVHLRIIKEHSVDRFSSFYGDLADRVELPALKYAADLTLNDRDRHLKLHRVAVEKNLRDISFEELDRKLKIYSRNHPVYQIFKKTGIGVALILFLATSLSFTYPDALKRTLTFWKAYAKPNPYSFAIEPGDATIEQGSSFAPKIHFEGDLPENVHLAVKTDLETTYRTRPLTPEGDRSYSASSISLNNNATYYVSMDGYKSDIYHIGVQLRPRFEMLSVTIQPPAYTRLDTSLYFYPFYQLQPYEGSLLTIRGVTNKEIDQIRVIASDSSVVPEREGNSIIHRWKVTQRDTLAFDMTDPARLNNKNPFEFVINPRQDEYPFVQLLEPGPSLEMKQADTLNLVYEAGDDFGLGLVKLHYQIQRAFVPEPETGEVSLPLPSRGNRQRTYWWDLTELEPRPRDVITYRIEVTDNDGYNGPKTTKSGTFSITFPSMAAYVDELEGKEQDIRQSLEDISGSEQKMREEYERFREQLQQNPETTWEQRQTLDEIERQREELEKQVEELNRKFQDLKQEMNESNMLSPETLKAYEELERLINEIDDPELAKALEELQNSLGNMNQEQLRRALEDFEFNEELYRERINRTLELFKSLKLNSDLEKMANILHELARKEEQLSESSEPAGQQIDQQEAVEQDTKELLKQLQKMTEDPPRRSRDTVEQLRQEGGRELEQILEQIRENLQELEKQPEDSSPGNRVRQQQQQIQQQFNRMAQRMRDTQQMTGQQYRQVNTAALEHILYSLITLSEEQEKLSEDLRRLSDRSPAFVEKARTQERIRRQFSQLSDSLYKVSSEMPRFSNRINEKKRVVERDLQNALSTLSERNRSQASYTTRQSLGGINELSSMIADLLEQIQNQEGQGGMGSGMTMQQLLKQLQNMSGDQLQLNQQIQELINDIQGNRLTQDQMERLNQMARQQNEIRKQLRELQRSGALESGDRVLSELERMTEEMENTINDLRGGQLDRLLIERQQNILSRMLEAEEAVEKRDEEERREGTSPEEIRRVAPDVTLEELQKKIRSLLNDPVRTQFTEDYQRLIEQYFELLKKLQEDGENDNSL